MRATRPILLAGLLLLLASPASAATDRCLQGAAAASDRAQIEAVRTAVESACPCASATSRGAYTRCARQAVRAAVDASQLRRECRATVNGYDARATCGLAPSAARVPCLKQGTGPQPKLSCAIKQASSCVTSPNGKVRRVACGGYTHCIDATDANADGLIGAGDELRCAVRNLTIDIPSGATPPNTPGSPGVVVTNPDLITQFGSASIDLNNARYTRFRAAAPGIAPEAILVLVPGFEGGSGGFKILAENLIVRMAREQGLAVEVWAFDRRSNQLEDRAGIRLAEDLGSAQVALDWFFGGEIGIPLNPALAAGPNRRAVFYDTQTDVPFLASWTNLVFSRDIDAVVEAAHAAVGNGNVFLGGHSAGTGFAARYAATDFNLTGVGPAEPGYAKLRGLVLLEGGGGSRFGTAPSEDTLDRIEARFDGALYAAVRDNAPRCADGTACTVATEATDCALVSPPVCIPPQTSYSTAGGLLNPRILASSEPSAIQGRTDPDSGQIIIQVNQAGPGTSAVAKVPDLATLAVLPQATVYGGIGSFVDDDGLVAGLASFVATSVGAPGPVVGGLTTWLDSSEPMPASAIPNNGPQPTTLPAGRWGNEKEVTRLDRMLGTFVAGDTNFSDWYYPSSGLSTTSGLVGLDSTPLSVGRGRRDIENLTQAASIDIPVIGFGGSNGLTPVPSSFRAFADSVAPCAAPSCNGTARVVDPALPSPPFPTYGGVGGGFEVYISEGYAHVDVLTAEDDATNQVVAPLAAFVARNVQ